MNILVQVCFCTINSQKWSNQIKSNDYFKRHCQNAFRRCFLNVLHFRQLNVRVSISLPIPTIIGPHLGQYLIGRKYYINVVSIISEIEHLFKCLMTFVFQAHVPDRLYCLLKGRNFVPCFFNKNPQTQCIRTKLILFLPKPASPLSGSPRWFLPFSTCLLGTKSCYFYLLLNFSYSPSPLLP